jgi:hypothetical protein
MLVFKHRGPSQRKSSSVHPTISKEVHDMRMRQVSQSFLLVVALSALVWAQTPGQNPWPIPGAQPGGPGTLNYVQGQAFIDGQAVNPTMIGSAQLQSDQALTTQNGKAEILLTPGAFLRMGAGGSVRMISPDLAGMTVQLERGHAMVEADQVLDHSNLQVLEGAATIHIEKHGLYDFNAIANSVRVFDGKAVVMQGGRKVDVDAGHEVFLSGPSQLKPQKFDRSLAQDDLYLWSQWRSGFVAEANVGVAHAYVPGGSTYGLAPWFGGGWYWNPWYGAYTFIPADGIFFSPFGWGFYSPFLVWRAPIHVYPGYGHSFVAGFRYGGGAVVARGFGPGGGYAARFSGGYSGAFARGFAGHGGGHGR